MNKIGLVLEGGGMRGLYTCGVLKFFLDKVDRPEKDSKKLRELFQNGYDDAESAYDRIIEFIG